MLGKRVLESEFSRACRIADAYQGRVEGAIQELLDIDDEIGAKLPDGRFYKSRYSSCIQPITMYCRKEIGEGIRFPHNFIRNACSHLMACTRLASKSINPGFSTGTPFAKILDSLKGTKIDTSLLSDLKEANDTICNAAFETRDAIVVYLILRKLAKRVLMAGGIDLEQAG